jgi:hypothetical protein
MGWEFYIGGCKVSFGASQIEDCLLRDYEKLAELEYSDDCLDQAGGQENFDRLMEYKDQINQELAEYGLGEELNAIDGAVMGEQECSEEDEGEEDPWWKFW